MKKNEETSILACANRSRSLSSHPRADVQEPRISSRAKRLPKVWRKSRYWGCYFEDSDGVWIIIASTWANILHVVIARGQACRT